MIRRGPRRRKTARRPEGKVWNPQRGYHEQCQRCKRWVPRIEIIRQLQQGGLHAGMNLVPYSSYSSSGWTAHATLGGAPDDEGVISMGSTAWRQEASTTDGSQTTTPYYSAAKSSTATPYGIQTWGDSGGWISTAMDLSAYTTVWLRVRAGLWHAAQDASDAAVALSVWLGDQDTAAGTVTAALSTTVSPLLSVVAVADLPSAAATRVVIQGVATNSTDNWWWDDVQVMGDPTGLIDPFIETTGSAVIRATDTSAIDALLVCRDCLGQRIDIINDYDYEPAEPPEIDEDMEVD